MTRGNLPPPLSRNPCLPWRAFSDVTLATWSPGTFEESNQSKMFALCLRRQPALSGAVHGLSQKANFHSVFFIRGYILSFITPPGKQKDPFCPHQNESRFNWKSPSCDEDKIKHDYVRFHGAFCPKAERGIGKQGGPMPTIVTASGVICLLNSCRPHVTAAYEARSYLTGIYSIGCDWLKPWSKPKKNKRNVKGK